MCFVKKKLVIMSRWDEYYLLAWELSSQAPGHLLTSAASTLSWPSSRPRFPCSWPLPAGLPQWVLGKCWLWPVLWCAHVEKVNFGLRLLWNLSPRTSAQGLRLNPNSHQKRNKHIGTAHFWDNLHEATPGAFFGTVVNTEQAPTLWP